MNGENVMTKETNESVWNEVKVTEIDQYEAGEVNYEYQR